MHDFREPKPNPAVIQVCKLILPAWLAVNEHLSVRIAGGYKQLMQSLRGKRVAILSNHPDRQDPFVICAFARQIGEEFYCMAAREVFDWDHGLRGWLFQRLGAYSVVRGKADFQSISTTKKLLLEGQKKLVLFPEAEITADEQYIQEIPESLTHIFLKTQVELAREAPGESLFILPLAIRYVLESNFEIAVHIPLLEAERRFGIRSSRNNDAFTRTRVVVEAYLDSLLRAYNLPRQHAGQDLEKLAGAVAENVMRTVSSQLSIEIDESLPLQERLYCLRYSIREQGLSDDSVRLQSEFHANDPDRLERLLILQRALHHPHSKLQAIRELDLIDSEVTGHVTPKGRQVAIVQLGEPLDVSTFLSRYRRAKEKTVRALTQTVRGALQSTLDQSRQGSPTNIARRKMGTVANEA